MWLWSRKPMANDRFVLIVLTLIKSVQKINFFLSRIDLDATSAHKSLSFMDIVSSYNQIQIASENEEKTVFTSKKDLYCYKVISFGLKNVYATYQHLINKVFKYQIN